MTILIAFLGLAVLTVLVGRAFTIGMRDLSLHPPRSHRDEQFRSQFDRVQEVF